MFIFHIILAIILVIVLVSFIAKPFTTYKNKPELKNPMEGKTVRFVEDANEKTNADGVSGHLEAIGNREYKRSFYDIFCKRVIDIVLSLLGLILLSPVFLIVCLAVIIDDPGPIFFSQRRVGKNKQFFKLHKFRTMKMCTPHDVPTHMLDNPEQYITRVGKFLRKSSLDELPQIWDIFIGNMSIIGPRPALWNQDLLTSERDKYDANDIRPGLTGWAQINGRDELEIPVKAEFDGQYANKLCMGGFKAFAFDIKCFYGTVFSVAKGEGVVEGGTGELSKR